jgi:hypothetical protein
VTRHKLGRRWLSAAAACLLPANAKSFVSVNADQMRNLKKKLPSISIYKEENRGKCRVSLLAQNINRRLA